MLLEELVLPLKTDSTAFKAGIAAAAAGVAALVAGMGLAIKATFKWADELDSIQDIMGVTNKTAAALNFTLRKSGTSTEALTKGMTILSKGLIKADGSLDTTGKSLKAWGINVLDANGILKDQTSLIGEISDKYSTFATQQEKVNFLTETFGRSGAELIDFFDTLAADGGIDAVAAKVERLGLAIDPNRYEQFNRNLEELKLVGLGLAVAFTEKVMPILEKFLEMISDPSGIDLGKIAAWADNAIGTYLKGLGDSVDSWVSSGGPEELSDDIVAWVENLGTGEAFKSKALIGAQHLINALGEAFGDIDWEAITNAIDEKMALAIGDVDWQSSGDAFGKSIEKLFSTSLDSNDLKDKLGDRWLLKLALPGIDGLVTFFQTSNVGQAISDAVASWFTGAVGPSNLAAWRSLGPNISAIVQSGMSGVTATMTTKLADFNTIIDNKLRVITKMFFNTAQGWAQQAVKGFESGKNAILVAIQGIVDAINAILRTIITPSFGAPVPPGGGGMGGGTGTGGGGGNAGGGNGNRRASGGPVIAGQSYSVSEFFKPERFTPNTNGRIDAMQPQIVTATIDEGRLVRLMIQAMAQRGMGTS